MFPNCFLWKMLKFATLSKESKDIIELKKNLFILQAAILPEQVMGINATVVFQNKYVGAHTYSIHTYTNTFTNKQAFF